MSREAFEKSAAGNPVFLTSVDTLEEKHPRPPQPEERKKAKIKKW
jgi:hypothetical protein